MSSVDSDLKMVKFDGQNMEKWYDWLEGYLQIKNSGTALTESKPTAVDPIKPTEIEAKKIALWEAADEHCRGFIRLTLPPHIVKTMMTEFKVTCSSGTTSVTSHYSISAARPGFVARAGVTIKTPTAMDMIEWLQQNYAKKNVFQIFQVLLKMIWTCIPSQQNPLQTLDRLCSQWQELISDGVNLPDFLYAMVLIGACGPEYDGCADLLTSQKKVDDVKSEDVCTWILARYDTRIGASMIAQNSLRTTDLANKMSAIHHAPGSVPNFRSQTNGHSGSGGQGNGCGGRGGSRGGSS